MSPIPPARLARLKAAREINSLHKFIQECLEPEPGNSVTLGRIYLRYLQWREPEAEQLGTRSFAHRFTRLFVRLVPGVEIYRDSDLQANVVWNVRLKETRP